MAEDIKQPQPKPQPKPQPAAQPKVRSKAAAWPIVVAVVVTLLIVGGIAYEAYNQKSDEFSKKEIELRNTLSNLETKSATLEQEKSGITSQLETFKQQLLDLTAKFTATSTGTSTASSTATTTAEELVATSTKE